MKNNVKWRGKSYGGSFGHKCFVLLLRHFGLRPAYFLLFFVALYFIIFRRKVYKESARYLKKILNPPIFKRFFCVYLHIYSFGKTLIDKWAYAYNTGGIEIENSAAAEVKKFKAPEKSMLVLSAHFGAWELSANLLETTYGAKAFILGINGEDEKISQALEKNRKTQKLDVIDQSADKISTLSAYALLKKGNIIAMQGDRNFGGRSMKVNFFDTQIEIPQSAFALAIKAEVPLVQIHCLRLKNRHYKIFAFPLYKKGEAKSIENLAQNFADNLEGLVKKYPYQWFNFYDFWNEE